MMRCLAGSVCLVLVLTMATGCTKQCFLSQKDFEDAKSAYLPPHLEGDPSAGVAPVTPPIGAPANVDQADRPPRHLSLQEAIAHALENGTVSDRNGQGGTGLANDNFYTFSGGSLNQQSDRIRVLAMNPAIAAAGLEQSLSRFDAQWVSGINWAGTDELQTSSSRISNGTNASFFNAIVKGLPSGGVASASFQVDHRDLSSPLPPNPLYTSRLSFGLEQPLWRDFGTDINQLLARFPSINGSAMPGPAANAFNNKLLPLNQSSQLSGNSFFTDGILIARIRFDSQRAEFERNLNNLVLNAEVAYWRLYQNYGILYSYEEVMRIAHQVWMTSYHQYKAGKKNLPEYAPVRAQYEEFRGERMKALGSVLEAERNLRRIIGLPVEDGTRLVPITAPTMAPFQPNWEAALKDTMALRPELVIAREGLRLSQLNLITQKNFLKPDLRFAATYTPVGFGTNLAGNSSFLDITQTPRTSNALRSLATDHFNDYTIGLTFNMPLGFRLEHATVRAAKLNLAQSYEVLKDQEDRATSVLTQNYQKLAEWYNRIQITNQERKNYGDAVQARYKEIEVGKQTPIDFLLDVQRRLALALTKEYEAIAEYNSTLARFEWAKGTLLPFNNIAISEGGLPECVKERAVENFQKRTHAIVVQNRPAFTPMTQPGDMVGDPHGPSRILDSAPSLSQSMPSRVPAEFLNSPFTKDAAKDAATLPGITSPATARPEVVPSSSRSTQPNSTQPIPTQPISVQPASTGNVPQSIEQLPLFTPGQPQTSVGQPYTPAPGDLLPPSTRSK